MIWNRTKRQLSFTVNDLAAMADTHMGLTEATGRHFPNPDIPPLWSVASFAMLYRGKRVLNFWRIYRHILSAAADPAFHYRLCPRRKRHGGLREVYAADYFLSSLQTFILQQILSWLPVDQHAFAYRKGVRMDQCAAPHTGKAMLIHLDITDFFGSITEDAVFTTLLHETGYPKKLCRLLTRLCCLRGRLPQGAATSPCLSNIVFAPCDNALAELAQEHGLTYTRYSDDLFFSGDVIDPAPFLKSAAQVLQAYGFFLNCKKTRIHYRQHRQQVLGLTVNDFVQVNREYRRQVLQQVHFVKRFGSDCLDARKVDSYAAYLRSLLGKINYVLAQDPPNPRFLKAQQTVRSLLLENEEDLY